MKFKIGDTLIHAIPLDRVIKYKVKSLDVGRGTYELSEIGSSYVYTNMGKHTVERILRKTDNKVGW